ncbi:hypothetical protein F5883DRAFT_644439 [Diaporthe sp. PMI_573]|nr:hypothetical protein F5883DRAFT_644439 [Diaporthaceae sp. PMI_573]
MESAFMDPNTTPIMMPPEGVVPNFEDPVSNAYITRDVGLVFFPLMIVFLILRLCSRVVITRSFGIDDFLHVTAAASTTAYFGILLSLLNAPNGRHGWDIPLSFLTDSYLQTNFTFVLMSAISIMLVKLSILALYLRMFKSVRLVNIVSFVCIGVVASFYVATVIAELVVGVPRAGEGGWQVAQMRYAVFGLDISAVRGAFGVVSDFAILFIPLSQVIQLHLPLKRKIILICIFLTGLLACISSIISCVYRFRERGDPDFTWANTMPNTFAVVEITVGHICGSMPVLPALIASLKKNETLLSFLRYLRSSRNKGYQSDTPTAIPSVEKADGLPSIPNGRLTGLRSFIQKVHLTRSSPKQTTLRSYTQSNYYDLECADVDYHSHLRKANAADTVTQQS